MEKPGRPQYVPALGFRILTPLYDLIVARTGRERVVKGALLRQAQLAPGQQVLDLATGTGTLAIWCKQQQPQVEVVGIDGDPEILAVAARKSAKAKVDVHFDLGLSYALPYPEDRFDRVFASMFLHHMPWRDKVRTLREIRRVLKPGAELHLADWTAPANALMRGLFLTVQLLDGFANTRDHAAGRLGELCAAGGLADVRQRRIFNTLYGTIALFSATKPD